MNTAPEGGAHDPRLDETGEEHPGVLPRESDLIALAATRRGLKVAAPGMLLVLCGVVPLDVDWLGPALLGVRFLGWVLLAVGLWFTASTPDGPLPGLLRSAYVLLFSMGAVRVLYDRFLDQPGLALWEKRGVWLLNAGVLLLPWILWRFCQHRGLTGRAITWLWCALALMTVFIVNFMTRSSWALWLCPVIGLILAVNAWQTARDVWLDAVYKNARVKHLSGG